MTSSAPEMMDGPPAPVFAPMRELGYADDGTSAGWWGSLSSERVPELRWPDAYDTYDDMARNPQVYSVLRAVMMPILRATARVDGTAVRPDITEHVAGNLGLPIVGAGNTPTLAALTAGFSFPEHLEVVIEEKLKYGHTVYEQKAMRLADGLWHLAKLGHRQGRTLSRFNTARDGGLISIEQDPPGALIGPGGRVLAPGSAKTITLPVSRVVVYARNRRGGNWRGESLLRVAYEPWLLKNRASRIELIAAERQGAPTPVYEAAEGETDLAAGRKIAQSLRAGTTSGAAIPNGAQIHQKGIEGSLYDLDKFKRYQDEQIARAVLAHFLNLGAQTGSWALGTTFADFFTLGLQAEADAIASVFSEHVIADLVGWNWPGERAPRLVFDEIGSRRDAVVKAIADLVTSGVLSPSVDLEQFVRTALGLPPAPAGGVPAADPVAP